MRYKQNWLDFESKNVFLFLPHKTFAIDFFFKV